MKIFKGQKLKHETRPYNLPSTKLKPFDFNLQMKNVKTIHALNDFVQLDLVAQLEVPHIWKAAQAGPLEPVC